MDFKNKFNSFQNENELDVSNKNQVSKFDERARERERQKSTLKKYKQFHP